METSDKRKVFVKLVPGHSVPRSVRESDLLNHFDTLKGKIEEVSAIRGRDTAQGFVRFKTQEAAKEAIARYHGTKLYGRFKCKIYSVLESCTHTRVVRLRRRVYGKDVWRATAGPAALRR